jgi:hypothetical protein
MTADSSIFLQSTDLSDSICKPMLKTEYGGGPSINCS